MWPYLLRRLAWVVVVLFGVSLLTFALTYGVPANPAQMVAGPQASVDTIQRIHRQLGLDRSLPEQYGLHALALLRGDLGHSWRLQRPVSALVVERIPATLLLALAGVLVQMLIGLPIGFVSAVRQGSRLDRALMAGSFLCLAAPPFWLGLVLLYTFGFVVPILPLGGYGTLRHLWLPALTIGLAFSPWYARVLRSSLLEVLDADFIRTARAKGLPGSLVLFRHALPNALRPVLTLMGNDLAHYLGGIIVVEQVFGWPGIGSLALEAILNVDIPVIMAVVFLSGAIVATVNLMVDLAYGLLDPPRELPVMAHGAEAPRSDVRVLRTVRIPMRDGIRLAATLYMPEATGRYPALLEYLPYRKDDMSWADAGPHHYFAAHGYVGVRLDVRGTGSSEGVTGDEYSPAEQQDALDTIAWLAAQPWCTGAVGMFGISYGGFTSLQAATHAPPALKAILPMHASDDRYTDDCHYGGGALRDYDTGRYGNRMLGWNALPPDPEVVGADWERIWDERLRGNEPWLLEWLRHQVDGPYWRSGSVRPGYARIRCPVFAIGGFRDGYVNAPLRLLQHCHVPVKVLLGPWPHQRPHIARPGPRIDWLHEARRWWDHWLKGLDTGIMAEPAVTLYVQDYDPPRTIRDTTAGYWRSEPTWPPPGAASLRLELGAHGRLVPADGSEARAAAGAPDDWDPIPAVPQVGLAGGIFSAGGVPFGLPLDQRAEEGYSLGYTTEPLSRPIEIAGQPRLRLRVASDAPVATLAAKLCDVAPDGTSALVTRSLLNLSHHRSHAAPEPLVAGRGYDVELELDCTAWRFAPGHRIRLDLAAADWPTVWPAPRPAGLRVSRSTGRLELMTLAPSTRAVPRFGEPAPLPVLADVQPETPRQEAVLDQMAEEIRIRGRIGRELSLPWGTSVQEFREMESILGCGESPTVSSRGTGGVLLRRTDVTVEVRTTLRVDATPATLDVRLELDVQRDGDDFFHRTWEESIERKLL